jgi:hypothetical protein
MQLIDICLSAPASVIRTLQGLEKLGYDVTSLVKTEINQSHLLELLNTSYLCRSLDVVSDGNAAKRHAD